MANPGLRSHTGWSDLTDMTRFVKSIEGGGAPHRSFVRMHRRYQRSGFIGGKLRHGGTEQLVAVDLGQDVSSVWSPATGSTAEPSLISLDAQGAIRRFGLDAHLLESEPNRRLRTVNLFDEHRAGDHLVGSFLCWLMERSKVVLCPGVSVFLALPPKPTSPDHAVVVRAIEQTGADVFEVHRPLAAAVAFDLPVDEPGCHLMAEVCETQMDIAVIRHGSVVISRRVHRLDDASVRSIMSETLRTLDPDDEIEIRTRGAHLYGWSAPRHAATSLAAIDLPLAAPVAPGATVLTGVRAIGENTLPWLMASR